MHGNANCSGLLIPCDKPIADWVVENIYVQFLVFKTQLHIFTDNLYTNYIKCYIKKEKPVKEFPYEYKTHMYHLHHKYIHELRDMNKYISFKEVINYVNNLEPPRLMHVINHQIKNK